MHQHSWARSLLPPTLSGYRGVELLDFKGILRKSRPGCCQHTAPCFGWAEDLEKQRAQGFHLLPPEPREGDPQQGLWQQHSPGVLWLSLGLHQRQNHRAVKAGNALQDHQVQPLTKLCPPNHAVRTLDTGSQPQLSAQPLCIPPLRGSHSPQQHPLAQEQHLPKYFHSPSSRHSRVFLAQTHTWSHFYETISF